MYEIDSLDEVVELSGVPRPEVGAPMPIVIADDRNVLIAYYTTEQSAVGGNNNVAVVSFRSCLMHMFGYPNDEALGAHPLYNRGLQFYGVFEIKNSSWVRNVERMNSVHPDHSKVQERYLAKKHLIFTFHDSTFECIVDGLDVDTYIGSMDSTMKRMIKRVYAR